MNLLLSQKGNSLSWLVAPWKDNRSPCTLNKLQYEDAYSNYIVTLLLSNYQIISLFLGPNFYFYLKMLKKLTSSLFVIASQMLGFYFLLFSSESYLSLLTRTKEFQSSSQTVFLKGYFGSLWNFLLCFWLPSWSICLI